MRLYSNKKEREAFENFAGAHVAHCCSGLADSAPQHGSALRCHPVPTSETLPVPDLPADLFAILKTTEKLERAYVRDAISAKDYEPGCQKLIGQFKTLWESLRDEVGMAGAGCWHCALWLCNLLAEQPILHRRCLTWSISWRPTTCNVPWQLKG